MRAREKKKRPRKRDLVKRRLLTASSCSCGGARSKKKETNDWRINGKKFLEPITFPSTQLFSLHLPQFGKDIAGDGDESCGFETVASRRENPRSASLVKRFVHGGSRILLSAKD